MKFAIALLAASAMAFRGPTSFKGTKKNPWGALDDEAGFFGGKVDQGGRTHLGRSGYALSLNYTDAKQNYLGDKPYPTKPSYRPRPPVHKPAQPYGKPAPRVHKQQPKKQPSYGGSLPHEKSIPVSKSYKSAQTHKEFGTIALPKTKPQPYNQPHQSYQAPRSYHQPQQSYGRPSYSQHQPYRPHPQGDGFDDGYSKKIAYSGHRHQTLDLDDEKTVLPYGLVRKDARREDADIDTNKESPDYRHENGDHQN